MGTFGTYILSIVGAVVLSTVAEIIMPEGKTAKYVRNTLSIFIVLIIISPVSKLFSDGIDFNSLFAVKSIETDYGFIDKLNERKSEALEEETEKYLFDNGYENVSVNILYTGSKEGIKIDYVHIDFTKFEFKDNKTHIHIIDNVIDLTSRYLSVEKENIYTYGTD